MPGGSLKKKDGKWHAIHDTEAPPISSKTVNSQSEEGGDGKENESDSRNDAETSPKSSNRNRSAKKKGDEVTSDQDSSDSDTSAKATSDQDVSDSSSSVSDDDEAYQPERPKKKDVKRKAKDEEEESEDDVDEEKKKKKKKKKAKDDEEEEENEVSKETPDKKVKRNSTEKNAKQIKRPPKSKTSKPKKDGTTGQSSSCGFRRAHEFAAAFALDNRWVSSLTTDGKKNSYQYVLNRTVAALTHAGLGIHGCRYLHTDAILSEAERREGFCNSVDLLLPLLHCFGVGSPFIPMIPVFAELRVQFVEGAYAPVPGEVAATDNTAFGRICGLHKITEEEEKQAKLIRNNGYYEVSSETDQKGGSWSGKLCIDGLQTLRDRKLNGLRAAPKCDPNSFDEFFKTHVNWRHLEQLTTWDNNVYVEALVDGEVLHTHLFKQKCVPCLHEITSGTNRLQLFVELMRYIMDGPKFHRSVFELKNRKLVECLAPSYSPLQIELHDSVRSMNDTIDNDRYVTVQPGIVTEQKFCAALGTPKMKPFSFTINVKHFWDKQLPNNVQLELSRSYKEKKNDAQTPATSDDKEALSSQDDGEEEKDDDDKKKKTKKKEEDKKKKEEKNKEEKEKEDEKKKADKKKKEEKEKEEEKKKADKKKADKKKNEEKEKEAEGVGSGMTSSRRCAQPVLPTANSSTDGGKTQRMGKRKASERVDEDKERESKKMKDKEEKSRQEKGNRLVADGEHNIGEGSSDDGERHVPPSDAEQISTKQQSSLAGDDVKSDESETTGETHVSPSNAKQISTKQESSLDGDDVKSDESESTTTPNTPARKGTEKKMKGASQNVVEDENDDSQEVAVDGTMENIVNDVAQKTMVVEEDGDLEVVKEVVEKKDERKVASDEDDAVRSLVLPNDMKRNEFRVMFEAATESDVDDNGALRTALDLCRQRTEPVFDVINKIKWDDERIFERAVEELLYRTQLEIGQKPNYYRDSEADTPVLALFPKLAAVIVGYVESPGSVVFVRLHHQHVESVRRLCFSEAEVHRPEKEGQPPVANKLPPSKRNPKKRQ